MAVKYAKFIVLKSDVSGVVPTIPVVSDHYKSAWRQETDIYEGEFFLNTADQALFTRCGDTIVQISGTAFAQTMASLQDVNLTGSPGIQDGDVLVYNSATMTWIPGPGGSIGLSGYSGTSGYSGVAGAAGTSGTSGTSGYSGLNGADGLDGISGYSGASGAIGVSGASGTSGKSGYSGFQGISGASGKSGYSGHQGAPGANGLPGLSGASGASGKSGWSGKSGYSGTSGKSGYSGASAYNEYTLCGAYVGSTNINCTGALYVAASTSSDGNVIFPYIVPFSGSIRKAAFIFPAFWSSGEAIAGELWLKRQNNIAGIVTELVEAKMIINDYTANYNIFSKTTLNLSVSAGDAIWFTFLHNGTAIILRDWQTYISIRMT